MLLFIFFIWVIFPFFEDHSFGSDTPLLHILASQSLAASGASRTGGGAGEACSLREPEVGKIEQEARGQQRQLQPQVLCPLPAAGVESSKQTLTPLQLGRPRPRSTEGLEVTARQAAALPKTENAEVLAEENLVTESAAAGQTTGEKEGFSMKKAQEDQECLQQTGLAAEAPANRAVGAGKTAEQLQMLDLMDQQQLWLWKKQIQQELDRTMDFWLRHSHDQEYGGFFTCLARDGAVYEEVKYVWLQGRQVWTYCRLYRTLPRFCRPEILNAAITGGEFLIRHARISADSQKCAFVLTRDGKAMKVQRTVFSECFYVMAMDELWRATGQRKYREEAVKMMDEIIRWVRQDPSELGRPALPGAVPTNAMAVPMMLLCLVQQLEEADEVMMVKYSEVGSWAVQQIVQHVQRKGKAVLENVSEDGHELPGSLGRHQNPGHAIEAGWFLLCYAVKHQDPELSKVAIQNFMVQPFQTGWDQEHGGLFSFLDVDGHCPTQLEWNMKMWWPHTEALIAFLMAYFEKRDAKLLQQFEKVFEFVFSKFTDPEHGEWFGYLSQEGKVALNIKGGPFKGCFHVPRCLYMCELILDKLLAEKV